MSIATYRTKANSRQETYAFVDDYGFANWHCTGCDMRGTRRNTRGEIASDVIKREVKTEALAHADTCRL